MNETVHSARKAPKRTNDPERTMAGIMAVATQEFAAKGLAGARIDAIAAATHTSKRMIYYYYGSKEGLYLAVLEDAYRRIRATEAELHLADLSPVEALKALVGFTFDHHHSNQDFIRLVMSENIQRGEYLSQSADIQKMNGSALATVQDIYTRGVKQGLFRSGLKALDIHSAISALSFFNVSNQHTFGLIFDQKTKAGHAETLSKNHVVQLILNFVKK